MHRRGSIATAISVLLAPRIAPARQVPPPAVPKPILLQRSPLAGFQYHEGAGLWPQLRPGQPLQLTREPADPHDRRAVRIDWRGHKLGYVPRRENTAISQLLDRGQPLAASISDLREGRDPWQKIEVAVHVFPSEAPVSDFVHRTATENNANT